LTSSQKPAGDPIEIHSSRFWALVTFKLTEFIFPSHLRADALGISLVKRQFWLTPWVRADEHLPMSHLAEVNHSRGLIWDTLSIESSGGLNPLSVAGLPKSSAAAFVTFVRAHMNG
jgi:hypothetical protein